MRKIILLMVVGMVVLSGLEAVALPFNMAETKSQQWTETPQNTIGSDDELDQYQTTYNWFGPVGVSPFWGNLNYIIAQGFTPTKNLLTRVELLIARNTTTSYDFTLGLRADLNDSDLVTMNVTAAAIPTNFSWVQFDFPDTMITPGQVYYLVASTTNTTDNFYGWGLNMTNVYPNGTVAWTTNNGVNWTQNSTFDLAFKTYGRQVTTLDLTVTGGFGITVNTKNTGGINATNVKTHVTITGGIFGLLNISEDVNTTTLLVNDSLPYAKTPLGLGPMSVTVVASADNAEEVTKTATGFILLFFVLIK